MSRNDKGRNNRCFLSLILCFCSILFLASCPGNGGASDSYGATYAYGGAGGMTGQNNKEPSAWEIKNMADAGDTDIIIGRLTGGQEGSGTSETTTPVDISVADMGLPAGTTGSVTITMTVNGTTRTYNASIEDDRVHFDIPAVPSNSEVSVRMDVRDGSGSLLLTGSTSKTVSGTDDALAVTLSDKIDVPVTVNGDVLFYAYRIHIGSTVKTEYSDSPTCTFSESLGTNIAFIEGYAVTTGFEIYSLPSVSVGTVTEDTSVTLSLESFRTGGIDDYISFSIYTDETWETNFANLATDYESFFTDAYDKGYFEIVDAHIELTSNYTGPTTTEWYPYDPASHSLTSGNHVRVRYKLKAGGITSGELFCTTEASTRTPPAP